MSQLDYSTLAVMLAVFVVYFLNHQSDSSALIVSTIVFSVLYIIWGIVHHVHNRTIRPWIVLEYFLVSILAILIVATLLI